MIILAWFLVIPYTMCKFISGKTIILTLFSIGLLRAGFKWRWLKRPHTCYTYSTMMKLSKTIPHRKKFPKCINNVIWVLLTSAFFTRNETGTDGTGYPSSLKIAIHQLDQKLSKKKKKAKFIVFTWFVVIPYIICKLLFDDSIVLTLCMMGLLGLLTDGRPKRA